MCFSKLSGKVFYNLLLVDNSLVSFANELLQMLVLVLVINESLVELFVFCLFLQVLLLKIVKSLCQSDYISRQLIDLLPILHNYLHLVQFLRLWLSSYCFTWLLLERWLLMKVAHSWGIYEPTVVVFID